MGKTWAGSSSHPESQGLQAEAGQPIGKETRRKEKAAIGGPRLVRADRDLAQQKEVSDHWKAGTDTIWVN